MRALAGKVSASTAKPWFWLVITTLPLSKSCTGVVGTVMAEAHFQGFRTDGEADQLVSQTNAENRLPLSISFCTALMA